MHNPHLKIPVRFSASDAQAVEQDSIEEITQNVEMIIRYQRGERSDDPGFGINDPNFTEGGANLDDLHAAIEYGEPRAVEMILRDPGLLERLIDNITIRTE